ncbi:MAG: cyclic nucleotide-binding protein [Pedosphaera sp.]|nr:cyclic nucleotide-binding protein [Pedosphaera sp.]
MFWCRDKKVDIMNAKAKANPSAESGDRPPASQPIQALASEHPFLAGMSAHQLRILSDCAMQSHFEPNELIFRAGDPADRFYLINRGKVALETQTDRGRTLIQTIGAGDVLGWSWLFPPYFWHFDVRALEPTDAIFIYGSMLREECEADHDLGYELTRRMAKVMLQRLQATRRQLLELPGMPTY